MARHKIIDIGYDGLVSQENHENIILHEDILNILFKHKKEVYRHLIDLQGTFLIDHIAITIIDPSSQMIIFSISPSVEYNLIIQGLWKYDQSYSVNFHKKNTFYIWEKAYSEKYFNDIKQIKEIKHGFTFGFNCAKKIDAFNLIYSYATRSKNNDLYEYYYNHMNELFGLGDYGYKLLQGIYAEYCNSSFELPSIKYKQNCLAKHRLKLIVNNKR